MGWSNRRPVCQFGRWRVQDESLQRCNQVVWILWNMLEHCHVFHADVWSYQQDCIREYDPDRHDCLQWSHWSHQQEQSSDLRMWIGTVACPSPWWTVFLDSDGRLQSHVVETTVGRMQFLDQQTEWCVCSTGSNKWWTGFWSQGD